MDRMGKAGRYLAKPRQGLLAARTVSRHKDDPGAHFRELYGSDLSDAGGASSNDNRLPLHETLPHHMALYRSVRGSAGFRSCTLYASLLADEKRERNCVALEAVSSRPETQCRGEGAPVVIPARFTEDVRADFRAQNRLDFRRIRAKRGEVTLSETAAALNISQMTVLRMIRNGVLPAQQLCKGACA